LWYMWKCLHDGTEPMIGRRMIRMALRKWPALLSGLVLVLVLAGCGGGGDSGAGAADPADPEAIYKRHCLSCHKADLSGMNLKTVGSRLTIEQIEEKIRKGGGGMIAFENRLSDEQIAALAAWLSDMK